ncbi:hypothetical protein ACMFMG_005053 [Clarireedia jacksonii]
MQKLGPKDESRNKNHFGPHQKEGGSDCFARLCLVSNPFLQQEETLLRCQRIDSLDWHGWHGWQYLIAATITSTITPGYYSRKRHRRRRPRKAGGAYRKRKVQCPPKLS